MLVKDEHKEKAKTYIKNLMHAATDAEREYMICFENGKYQPELLFDDKKIIFFDNIAFFFFFFFLVHLILLVYI